MIFSISIILVFLFWALERFLGIPWDFHPDAETYATSSNFIAYNVLSNPIEIFNNAHYVFVAI